MTKNEYIELINNFEIDGNRLLGDSYELGDNNLFLQHGIKIGDYSYALTYGDYFELSRYDDSGYESRMKIDANPEEALKILQEAYEKEGIVSEFNYPEQIKNYEVTHEIVNELNEVNPEMAKEVEEIAQKELTGNEEQEKNFMSGLKDWLTEQKDKFVNFVKDNKHKIITLAAIGLTAFNLYQLQHKEEILPKVYAEEMIEIENNQKEQEVQGLLLEEKSPIKYDGLFEQGVVQSTGEFKELLDKERDNSLTSKETECGPVYSETIEDFKQEYDEEKNETVITIEHEDINDKIVFEEKVDVNTIVVEKTEVSNETRKEEINEIIKEIDQSITEVKEKTEEIQEQEKTVEDNKEQGSYVEENNREELTQEEREIFYF